MARKTLTVNVTDEIIDEAKARYDARGLALVNYAANCPIAIAASTAAGYLLSTGLFRVYPPQHPSIRPDEYKLSKPAIKFREQYDRWVGNLGGTRPKAAKFRLTKLP